MKSSRFSRRLVPLVGVLAIVGLALSITLLLPQKASAAPALRFDFGDNTAEPGYVAVGTTQFSAQSGFGWLDTGDLALRDRQNPDDLRRDFVMGKGGRTFRVAGLTPGLYRLTVVCGDTEYGDHTIQVSVPGTGELPLLSPQANEFITLSATVEVKDTLDIVFQSPANNWVVNSLILDPATAPIKPTIMRQAIAREPAPSTWVADTFKTDPTKPLLDGFRRDAKAAGAIQSTGLTRADYLKLIAGEVDFWKGQQDANGAIIDPYKKEEWQYSTPAFACAAATLIAYDKRGDLLEPASKAMDWATLRLSQRKAATGHEDFYPPMLAHALMMLKGKAAPERLAQWETNLRSYDPYRTYRQGLGSMNWNIVSSSGEMLFAQLGLRPANSTYPGESLGAQGRHFTSPYGLYLEGPLAYDHFPRIFLSDALEQGYKGPHAEEVATALGRAAITSLFMQSPWGELPAGGRSAHHQWNEAEQCVTYEIYADKAQKAGDVQMAGAYKRAAHLALASMQRWVRPSGEMQIVKNWVDPSQRFAYEGYSAHSQYNLLPMAMLSLAYEYAGPTENMVESPAPADVGGFVFEIPELHKVFANAGGTYVELDTTGDPHYDATGLIRVHSKGISPQLGPSDGLLAHASYTSPNPIAETSGVGVAWQGADGRWMTLGAMDKTKIKEVKVTPLSQSAARVAFDVAYEGELGGPSRITEHYIVTAAGVELSTELTGYTGALRYQWPVLADDGRTPTTIETQGNVVTVTQKGSPKAQTFEARGAQSVTVGTERYSNHNGWARLAVAEYPQGGKITLVIAPK